MDLTSLKADFSQLSSRIKRHSSDQAHSVASLSSGSRLVNAGDDIANLSISTRILTHTTALRSVITNLSQASSALQVMDGGMRVVQDNLERMSQISVMANNGAISNQERAFLDIEFQQLQDEINRVSQETNFNGVDLLNGTGNFERSDTFTSNGNIIYGTDDVDVLQGSGANETFIAGAGNDKIIAGAGNDSIDAGTGRDNVFAGAGDDRITVDATSPVELAPVVPVQDNLAIQFDPSNTASLTGHPGNVTQINDLGAFNNDAFADTGNVVSGQDELNGLNGLTFDGNSFMRINDTADLNLGNLSARTIMLSFQTGADINSRQVLYEQGGTVNGFNIYIDSGQLFVGAYKGTGANFDFHIPTPIEPNTTYAAGLVFDFATSGTFRGYLNGGEFANVAVTQTQSAHSGDIGLGGMNQDSRFHDGSVGGDGFEFQGVMGEFVNYRDALNTTEAQAVQDYLVGKWVSGLGADYIVGGEGIDTLTFENEAVNLRLDGSTVQGIENIILARDDDTQSVTVTDDYFAAGTGVETEALLIDATLAVAGFSFSGSTLSSGNTVIVKESMVDDTFNGNSNSSVVVSYEDSGIVDINLLQETASARGTDTLNEINAVIGSEFGDRIFGSTSADTLSGGGGADVIGDFTSSTGRLVTRDLVHYSSMSNLAGVTGNPGDITGIQDLSGSNNHVIDDVGTTESDASTEINGQPAVFFGSNSLLTIATTNDINNAGQDQRSIFTTIKTSGDISSRQMIYEEGGTGNGYSMYIEGGRAYVNMWQGGAGGLYLQQSVDIDANETYSLGFVFDSSGEGDFTGYLNGVNIGSQQNTVAQLAHSGRIGIGGVADNTLFLDGATTSGSFNGSVGELLIYNSALSDDELEDLNGMLLSQRVQAVGGADVMNGGDGNDSITGGGGNDTIDGGAGFDKAYYTGARSDYNIQQLADGSTRVTDLRSSQNDGSDVVRNVEQLVFGAGEKVTLTNLDDDSKLIYRSGDESGQYLRVDLPNFTTKNLFRDQTITVTTQENAARAFDVVKDAMDYLISERARIGSELSSVDILVVNTSNALGAQDEARGRLADTDIAQTSTEYAQQMVRGQVSIAISAQTNSLREELVLGIIEDATDVALTTNSTF